MESSLNNPYNAPASDLSHAGESGETYEPQILAIAGRIGRLRYLAYTFGLTMACGIIAAIVTGILGVISPKLVMLGLIVYLPALAISFIMAIRRLNDLGYPGWWCLLSIVPLINLFFGLWIVFWPGNAGSNNYGLPPTRNSIGVVILAVVVPLLMVAVLAAVAIPAYQGYVLKAKAARGGLPAPAQLQAQ